MELNRNFFFLLLIFFATTTFSCNNARDKLEIEKSASAFDIKQGEASILQSNQHFMKSFEGGDSVEIAESYTTDAGLMPPNHNIIIGRKNILHYFSKAPGMGTANLSLKTVNVWGDSSILAEEGTYRILDKKKNEIDKGKYIVLWKQETGNWKMYRDIWASDLPIGSYKADSISLLKN